MSRANIVTSNKQNRSRNFNRSYLDTQDHPALKRKLLTRSVLVMSRINSNMVNFANPETLNTAGLYSSKRWSSSRSMDLGLESIHLEDLRIPKTYLPSTAMRPRRSSVSYSNLGLDSIHLNGLNIPETHLPNTRTRRSSVDLGLEGLDCIHLNGLDIAETDLPTSAFKPRRSSISYGGWGLDSIIHHGTDPSFVSPRSSTNSDVNPRPSTNLLTSSGSLSPDLPLFGTPITPIEHTPYTPDFRTPGGSRGSFRNLTRNQLTDPSPSTSPTRGSITPLFGTPTGHASPYTPITPDYRAPGGRRGSLTGRRSSLTGDQFTDSRAGSYLAPRLSSNGPVDIDSQPTHRRRPSYIELGLWD